MTQQVTVAMNTQYLTRIRKLIIKHFSDSDLRTLCADLGVDYDSLRGEGKANKVRELVLELERCGRISELVDLCTEQRPNVTWTEQPPEAIDVLAVESVKSGLSALIKLMQVPEIYAAVALYHNQFQQARQHITLLQGYKDLHDQLHHLKFHCYDPIMREAQRFPDDEITGENLVEYERNLRDIVDNLRRVLNTTPLRLGDTAWIDSLDESRNELHSAVAQSDPELLKRAIWRIRRVLDLQPSYINAHLSMTAKQLLELKMQQPMQRLYAELVPLRPAADQFQQFAAGVSALAELRQRLDMLITDHDAWQSIERELRQIETGLRYDTQELELSWPELLNRIKQLYWQRTEVWAVALSDCAEELNQAIITHDRRQITTVFRRCCREVSTRFYQVDANLKHLCTQLGKFDDPLALF